MPTVLDRVPTGEVNPSHLIRLACFFPSNAVHSQLLAEFDLPPSGLGKLAGTTPLPLTPNPGDSDVCLYQFFFLALITMRKLLNRILYYLYGRGM